MRAQVGAVVLAAGASVRLGRPKQLLPFAGATLLRAMAARACASGCDRVAVVLGARSQEVLPALAGLPLAVRHNSDWQEGISSSIRCAVAWAAGEGCDAALLLVCDQPGLTTAHLDRLVGAYWATGGGIVASRYDGVLGVPAVFDRRHFPALLELQGEQGARRVIRGAADVTAIEWPEGAVDVDTPEDAARLG